MAVDPPPGLALGTGKCIRIVRVLRTEADRVLDCLGGPWLPDVASSDVRWGFSDMGGVMQRVRL